MRIGIDLGGTKIEGIALHGSVEVTRARVDTPRDNYEATLEAVVNLVDLLESRAPNPEPRISNPQSPTPSVGLGIPGTLSTSTGLVKNANSTWLIGRPLQHDLEGRLGRPVRVANDANCFAVSEATDGAAAGAQVVFGVILGTGVGGGVVCGGRIVNGANGIAGEWGHNPLPWPDLDAESASSACYCGKQGCIETFLSGPGMAADHERASGQKWPPRQIVQAAETGDKAAEETLRRYEGRLARALAGVINVLDPDVIVLGGGISNIARLYANVPQRWGEFIFSCGAGRDEIRTALVPARHGDASGVRGAAWLWSEQ